MARGRTRKPKEAQTRDTADNENGLIGRTADVAIKYSLCVRATVKREHPFNDKLEQTRRAAPRRAADQTRTRVRVRVYAVIFIFVHART
jgi:hypothetical protein